MATEYTVILQYMTNATYIKVNRWLHAYVYRGRTIYYDSWYDEFYIVGHGNIYTRLSSAKRAIDRLLRRP